MTSLASSVVSYTLSFAVTIAVTGFFSARNDQVAVAVSYPGTVPVVTWTSSDPNTASIDQNGLVTVHKSGGPVTITATRTVPGYETATATGFAPVMLTVLFVPTFALLNLPVKLRGMLSFPKRSPSFHVMTSLASSVVSYTLSFAVTIAVTGLL